MRQKLTVYLAITRAVDVGVQVNVHLLMQCGSAQGSLQPGGSGGTPDDY